MGDRANLKFVEDDGGTLFFYSHWGGPEMVRTWLHRALSKRERWNDSQYLAAIIMREVVRDNLDETTGVGLSTQIGDNSHEILTADFDTQTVTLDDKSWTFEEFVSQKL